MNNKLENAYDYYYDTKEYDKAYKLFLDLAQENVLDAQIVLAYMLFNGYGTEKNIEKSYYWYKISANNGDASSSNFYSFYCFENNNIAEGKFYLEKAVDANYIDAIYNMAIYCLNGQNGYQKDERKAISLFKKSALLGDMESYLQIWRIIAKKSNKKRANTYMANEFGLAPCFKLISYRLSKFFKRTFNVTKLQYYNKNAS